MFLDDELYQHTINRNIESSEDFKAMMNELYRICGNRWKSKITINSGYEIVTCELDRVFNAWNLFVKRLDKEDYFLTDFISEYSYKKAFMENEKARKIYLIGK